jgi:hypothetical protein
LDKELGVFLPHFSCPTSHALLYFEHSYPIQVSSNMTTPALTSEKAKVERVQLEPISGNLNENVTSMALDEYARNEVKNEHEMTPLMLKTS